MKSIFQFLAILMAMSLLHSCGGSTGKPSLIEMRDEKMTLVQIFKPISEVRDVFGDSVKTNPYYYLYTDSHQLVPVSIITEGGSLTVESYLRAKGLQNEDGSDTIEIHVGYANTVIKARQFRLKNIKLSPAKLNM